MKIFDNIFIQFFGLIIFTIDLLLRAVPNDRYFAIFSDIVGIVATSFLIIHFFKNKKGKEL